ncbi:uncharacterized protein LOC111869046 isoform X2 [Cryptotermes secundus]|uniref:uncharacterized protein LOC111869046 isoform X2 n=1 Tax=Cryptotermes secundus TaxID=105785 RepID=UPI000CD7D3B3|nr:uncharacterized protein LOC111869046 isoform X2 [Cryptotermes secundus]
MKERKACRMDEHNCSSELGDAFMQCGDLLDILALTQGLQDGPLDIYDMAERLTNLLGRGEPLITMATSDDEDEDEEEKEDNEANDRCGSNMEEDEWISGGDNSGERDHRLLLAGYSDCMTEALRYLVEEERYSPEHPVVEGLRTHLAQQQDRVLLEAARAHHHHNHHRHVVHLDNSRPTVNNNNNNSSQVVEVRNRMALLADTLCNIRPPAV